MTVVGRLRPPHFGGYEVLPPPEGISNRDIVTTQWNQGFLRFLTVTIDESVTVTIRTGGGDGRLVIEGQLRGFPPPEAISDRDKCDKPMKSGVFALQTVNRSVNRTVNKVVYIFDS